MLKAQSTGPAAPIHGHLGWKCGPVAALGLWEAPALGMQHLLVSASVHTQRLSSDSHTHGLSSQPDRFCGLTPAADPVAEGDLVP